MYHLKKHRVVILVMVSIICLTPVANMAESESVSETTAGTFTVTEYDRRLVLDWDDTWENNFPSYPNYAFEGYTLYQSRTPAGAWQRIANFDVVNGVDTIYDSVFNSQSGLLEYIPVKFGTDNGLQYTFDITRDSIADTILYNENDYYYRLEAYVYDETASPKTLTAMSIVAGTPTNGSPEPYINFMQWAAGSGGNDHYYAVIPMTYRYDDALAYAQTREYDGQYGYLATSISQEENDFIINTVMNGLWSTTDHDQYWLGATYETGAWDWGIAEDFDYANWDPGDIPIIDTDYGVMMCGHHPIITSHPAGAWYTMPRLLPAWAVIEWGDPIVSAADETGDAVPGLFSLSQNVPNPFNPATTIEYTLERRARVRLTVYDVLGRTVAIIADGEQAAGVHQAVWDGRTSDGTSMASGVYFYRLEADGHAASRQMVLMR